MEEKCEDEKLTAENADNIINAGHIRKRKMEMEMEKKILSCVDCAVTNCNLQDKQYPDFCATTHMDEEVLAEALVTTAVTKDRVTGKGAWKVLSFFVRFPIKKDNKQSACCL